MELSIVIPAFNEHAKIAADLTAAAAFLRENRIEGEIVVVDDGSTDGTSQRAAEAAAAVPGVRVRILRNEAHAGKGAAVRDGVLAAGGAFMIFADSGNCVPWRCALAGLEMLRAGRCDIAHGSRKLPESRIRRNQGPYRRLCSRLFHWFVVRFMGVPGELTDTQCGFKLYRGGTARDLYAACGSRGFAFDIEIILRAPEAHCRILEFPIEWSCDPDSRLQPAHSALKVLRELVAIKRRLAKE